MGRIGYAFPPDGDLRARFSANPIDFTLKVDLRASPTGVAVAISGRVCRSPVLTGKVRKQEQDSMFVEDSF